MIKDMGAAVGFMVILFVGIALAIAVFASRDQYIKSNSEVTVVELDIIDKEKDTHMINTGSTIVPVTNYYLKVEFGNEVKNVSITSSSYDSINTPCSALFSVYYDADGNMIDIELN